MTAFKAEESMKKPQNKTFSCTQCDKCFKSEKSLRIHEQNFHGDKNFKCDLCDKTFYTEKQTLAHIATHNKTFKCELCGKEFDKNVLLMQHNRYEHQNVPKPKCTECSQTFSSNLSSGHTGSRILILKSIAQAFRFFEGP